MKKMGEKAYTESFARIYDDIMGGVPYDIWYNYIRELLDYYHKKPERVLDLACGTGNMSLRFAQNGYQVVGLDRSCEMLKVARNKALIEGVNIEFAQADLRNFQFSWIFDLAISLFDSFNYILNIRDLKEVFSNVYNILQEDGLFIFDMNTPRRLMSIKPGITMLTGDNYTCFWEDIIDRDKKRWQVKLRIYFNGNKTRIFEEFHEETGYPMKEIIQALDEVGFQYVNVFNAYTFDRGDDGDNRLYYVAFKDSSLVKESSLLKKAGKKVRWKLTRTFMQT